jgi:hypothetical protein
MIRLKLVRVFQAGQMGAIRIYKRARPKDAPHPIHDPEDEYKAHHPVKSVVEGDAPRESYEGREGHEGHEEQADQDEQEGRRG